MGIMILAEHDETYELARRFAGMGMPTVYYRHGADRSELDKADVLHVASWRTHLDDATVVVTDSPVLLLTYRTTKHDAPVLYIPRPWPHVKLPPEASDYLLSLVAGAAKPRKRWWRRNGLSV